MNRYKVHVGPTVVSEFFFVETAFEMAKKHADDESNRYEQYGASDGNRCEAVFIECPIGMVRVSPRHDSVYDALEEYHLEELLRTPCGCESFTLENLDKFKARLSDLWDKYLKDRFAV